MLFAEEPCCGCLPQPPHTIEPEKIVQRPAQRVEVDAEPLDEDDI